jgi:hypothetical protein
MREGVPIRNPGLSTAENTPLKILEVETTVILLLFMTSFGCELCMMSASSLLVVEGWTVRIGCATTADDAAPCSGWARVCVLSRMRLYALLVAAVLSAMPRPLAAANCTNTCMNGGALTQQGTCACLDFFGGVHCETMHSRGVFFLDGACTQFPGSPIDLPVGACYSIDPGHSYLVRMDVVAAL